MTTPPRARWFLALLAALATTGCGKTETEEYPSPPPADPSVRSPLAPMTVSHVLIAMATGDPNSKTTRTKASALLLAKEVIADFKAKRRSWQDLVDRFSDDKDPTGKANSMNMVDRRDKTTLPPGTYVINELTDFVAPFKEAVKKLAVGEVTPEPVETQFGYHVILRVK